MLDAVSGFSFFFSVIVRPYTNLLMYCIYAYVIYYNNNMFFIKSHVNEYN
jgi:hypothetical protein